MNRRSFPRFPHWGAAGLGAAGISLGAEESYSSPQARPFLRPKSESKLGIGPYFLFGIFPVDSETFPIENCDDKSPPEIRGRSGDKIPASANGSAEKEPLGPPETRSNLAPAQASSAHAFPQRRPSAGFFSRSTQDFRFKGTRTIHKPSPSYTQKTEKTQCIEIGPRRWGALSFRINSGRLENQSMISTTLDEARGIEPPSSTPRMDRRRRFPNPASMASNNALVKARNAELIPGHSENLGAEPHAGKAQLRIVQQPFFFSLGRRSSWTRPNFMEDLTD